MLLTIYFYDFTCALDVFHSINAPNNFWYGSEDVIDYWFPVVKKAFKEASLKRLLAASEKSMIR